MRIETIGAATLYLGDAREILPGIPKSNLLLSDPPYRLTSGGNSQKNTNDTFRTMGGWMKPGAEYANSGAPVLCDLEFSDWMPLVYDALVDDADAYLMANDKNQREMQNEMIGAGFGFHNLLVWNKVTPVPNRWYMKNLEFVIFGWKGRARTINDPSSKQLMTCPQKDVTDHPTEKPVQLMTHYIENSSSRGDVVLDPFMGTGTTGVAALECGRAFIGIELSERWFDVACERMSKARPAPVMFEEKSQCHQMSFGPL